MNRKNIFLWVVFCISLFIGGYFLGEVLFSKQTLPSETVLYSPPPPNPELDKANELRTKYIDGLAVNGDVPPGGKSVYLATKKNILDAYRAGDRSENLMRAYIYLTAQEGNFVEKEKALNELCEKPQNCEDFLAEIHIKGNVRDPQWKPIAKASVEILGTSYKTVSDIKGEYSFTFKYISPAVLRLQASFPNSMIGVKRITLLDNLTSSAKVQSFEKNFILAKAFTEIVIDTKKRTISWDGASITDKGYFIVTPYTKYLIPFDGIVEGETSYVGKVKALVFEFDRQSSSYLLDADVFDQVAWLISQSMVTYGMPYIIFSAENGTKLDVLSSNPIHLATTNRESDETDNLLLRKEHRELFEKAYTDSQKSPDTYPIDSLWEYNHGNKRIVPLYWSFDRKKGYWNNVGFRFASNQFTAPYNIESILYTVNNQEQ